MQRFYKERILRKPLKANLDQRFFNGKLPELVTNASTKQTFANVWEEVDFAAAAAARATSEAAASVSAEGGLSSAARCNFKREAGDLGRLPYRALRDENQL